MASKKDKNSKSSKTAHVLNLITTPAQRQAAQKQAEAEAAQQEGTEASAQPVAAAPGRPLTPPIVEMANSQDNKVADLIRSALSDELEQLAEPAPAPTASVPPAEKLTPIEAPGAAPASERIPETLTPETEPAQANAATPDAIADALAQAVEPAQANAPALDAVAQDVSAPAEKPTFEAVTEALAQAIDPAPASTTAPNSAPVSVEYESEDESIAPESLPVTAALANELASISTPAPESLTETLSHFVEPEPAPAAAAAASEPTPTAAAPIPASATANAAPESVSTQPSAPESVPAAAVSGLAPATATAPAPTSIPSEPALAAAPAPVLPESELSRNFQGPAPTPTFGSDLVYLNIMQTLVESMAPRYIKMFDVCPCSRCNADVKALTLTNLTPKYAVFHKNERVPMLTVYENRYGSLISAQLTKACSIVKTNPHHR